MLYQLVDEYLDEMLEGLTDPNDPNRCAPAFVEKEFRAFLECGRPEFGHVRFVCRQCKTERTVPFSCKGRAICPSCCARRMEDSATHLAERVLPAVPIRQWVLSPPSELCGLLAARGAVLSKMSTLFVDAISRNLRTWAKDELGLGKVTCGAVVILQRFTNTLAVFPHLHILFLDGVYEARDDDAPPVFHACPPPDAMTMLNVGRDFFSKMERYLAKNGFLDGDHEREMPEDGWFVRATHEPSMLEKAPTHSRVRDASTSIEFGGFSLHAGVTVRADDLAGRKRLCRYALRPPLAEDQLRRTADGDVELELKKKTRAGQTHIRLTPIQLLRKLAWLIAPPRQHQIRFHGVLAPHAKVRADVVPTPDGETIPLRIEGARTTKTDRAPWARLLKNVYDIDGLRCERCGGTLRPVDAMTRRRILERRESKATDPPQLVFEF